MSRRQRASRREDEQACAFCAKTKADGVRLVQGPAVSICRECVELAFEIVSDDPPPPSVIQECAVVLEDGTRHLVAGGLRETVVALGLDDSSIVTFDLVDGGRFAVRREAVRHLLADPEPVPPPREPPEWAADSAKPVD